MCCGLHIHTLYCVEWAHFYLFQQQNDDTEILPNMSIVKDSFTFPNILMERKSKFRYDSFWKNINALKFVGDILEKFGFLL